MKKKETMRARLGTAGRLAGGLLAGLLAMTAARANETTWIGPAAGGAWHDVQNWDNGVPTADSTVHIAVEGDMTIAPTAQQNATLLRLRTTGEGTLTIPHTGNGLFFGKDADGFHRHAHGESHAPRGGYGDAEPRSGARRADS